MPVSRPDQPLTERNAPLNSCMAMLSLCGLSLSKLYWLTRNSEFSFSTTAWPSSKRMTVWAPGPVRTVVRERRAGF